MTTFFSIFFIILGVNLVLMFFSLSGITQRAKKTSTEESKTSISKINPIDLIPSEYKEAV
jgi:hypothetical protein